ncbi:MAG: ABC transporter substrate-binding protein [Hyphomicrobiales bacterium]|nr:ABC transporter substrate-binding protein [Hyphomicrobiales bacterium]
MKIQIATSRRNPCGRRDWRRVTGRAVRKVLVPAVAALLGALLPAKAQQLAKVTYGTNWLAEAEHGGFYQAVADGTYKKYGLDVTIVQGGPNNNLRLLMSSGKIDFFMGTDMIQAMSAVAEGIPTVVVAGMFQKDPQVLMSHPGEGLDTFASLKDAHVVLVSKEAVTSFYRWLESAWGFSEEKIGPYNFNPAAFIRDKKSVQQGFATSEPYAVEKVGGFKPNVFLLADNGFDTVATTIEGRRDFVEKNPDVVQRFVDASVIGWYHYLYGDNRAANELIKKDNPEMTDEQIAYSIAKLKEYGIVDSGDSLKNGIGAMSDARMKSFYDQVAKAGVLPQGLDYKKSYTLQFVNKGVGLDLRPK